MIKKNIFPEYFFLRGSSGKPSASGTCVETITVGSGGGGSMGTSDCEVINYCGSSKKSFSGGGGGAGGYFYEHIKKTDQRIKTSGENLNNYMEDKIGCPYCSSVNSIDALECRSCGGSLNQDGCGN